MKHYHVNHNMPGYSPEADGTHTVDWSEALSAFGDEIKAFQGIWAEECSANHQNEEEQEKCYADGSDGCAWNALYNEAEADRLGFEFLDAGSEAGFIYETPEGADVSIWLRSCSEADCVMTCDES